MGKTKRASRKLGLEPPAPIPDAPELDAKPVSTTAVARSLRVYTGYNQLDGWEEHPGYGLTARKLIEIFGQAEAGFPAQQADLFNDIQQQDGHLYSQMSSRTRSVVGKEWIMQPGGDEQGEVLAAATLEQALRRTNWMMMFSHQLRMPAFGYACSEIIWSLVDGWIVPTWFYNVPHRRFRFVRPLDEMRLLTHAQPTEGELMKPGAWIISRAEGDQSVRAGYLRVCAWLSMFKRMSLRDWVIYAERFGIPYVTGEYTMNASQKDKDVLKQAATSLGKDGAAIFADTCKLVVHEVKSGGRSEDVHGAICSYCDSGMSKVIKGSTLGSETQGPGSYALGAVHQETSFDIVMADEARFSEQFTRSVAAPFMHYNGMPEMKAPRLKIHVTPHVDSFTRAQVLDIVLNKLRVPLDMSQMRAEFQVKEAVADAIDPPPIPAPAATGNEPAPQ